jgi:hypothetical protein
MGGTDDQSGGIGKSGCLRLKRFEPLDHGSVGDEMRFKQRVVALTQLNELLKALFVLEAQGFRGPRRYHSRDHQPTINQSVAWANSRSNGVCCSAYDRPIACRVVTAIRVVANKIFVRHLQFAARP